ncbi:hypothetical protein [Spiroplasma endosymbiont of Zeiraphera isertana]
MKIEFEMDIFTKNAIIESSENLKKIKQLNISINLCNCKKENN